MHIVKAAAHHSADRALLVFDPRRRGPQIARLVREPEPQPALDIGGR